MRKLWATCGFTLQDKPRPGRPRVFSALARAVVIAVACELPSQRQLPFSRHSAASIQEVAVGEGIMVSVPTVQRILTEDTLKPWHYRSWIHPRDPDFRAKAAVILDLYQGVWQGRRLGPTTWCCARMKSLESRPVATWGRCEPKNNIAAFDRLVEQVMTQDPYLSAGRVFWIVDSCSSHRGRKAVDRLKEQYPISSWCTLQSTHPGSTSKRFTSGSSSARC